jgi:hypothetical protein
VHFKVSMRENKCISRSPSMRLNHHHIPRFGYFSLVLIFTGLQNRAGSGQDDSECAVVNLGRNEFQASSSRLETEIKILCAIEILQHRLARSHQIFDVTCPTNNCKTHYWMRYWKILLKSGRPTKILQNLAKYLKITA